MQTSPARCLTCRPQQLVAALRRPLATPPPPSLAPFLLQPSSKAYGTSTGMETSTDSPNDSQTADDDVALIDFVDFKRPPDTTRDRAKTKREIARQRYKKMLYKKGVIGHQKQPHKQDSLKIFSKVVQQQLEQEESAAPPAPRDLSPESVAIYNNIAKLRPMMKEQSIEDCYEFFMDHVMAKAVTPEKSRLVKQRGSYLLKRVAETKTQDMDNRRLPSISQLTSIYHQLGTLNATNWTSMIMGLIKYILSINSTREAYASDEEFEKARAKKHELLGDLIESWVLFNRRRLSVDTSSHLSPEEAEFRFPLLDPDQLRLHAKRGLAPAFSLLFSQYSTNSQDIPAAAIATFVVLVDSAQSNADLRLKASPLLHPVRRILLHVQLSDATLRRIFEPHSEILEYVLRQWQDTMEYLQGPYSRKPAVLKETQLRHTFARINYALGMVDVAELEAAWNEFWGGVPHEGRKSAMSGCGPLFDHFLMAFTALKRPELALEVWQKRSEIGIPLTLRSWTAMMSGCVRARNLYGLENIWKKLLATGQQLDQTAWSVRIVGLLDCGEPSASMRGSAAVKALDEMYRSDVPGGVTIAMVNVVVAGLIRLDAPSAASEVLHWAIKKGIEPDTITYNTLLRPLVRQADAKGIRAHLQKMIDNKTEPDAATITILLDGLLAHIKGAAPEAQRIAVANLIASIEATRIELNMEIYARMIHVLIKQGTNHSQAVHGPGPAISAVYQHIIDRGLRPSPHVFTVLVEYCLTRDPPAFAQVIQLLHDCGVSFDNNGNVITFDARYYLHFDRVFFERIITGFALAGYPDHAFGLFERVSNITNAMTLSALEKLLRCLVAEGRMDKAKSVVDLAWLQRASEPPPVEPARSERPISRYWKHGFWAYAIDCGFITEKDVDTMKATQLSATAKPL